MATDTAYCPTCRTHREVMDTYETDDGARYSDGDRARVARPLSCGHDAGDGGHTPYPARPVRDTDLVQRVADLQAGRP
jgi:hypothetical protein